MTDPFLILGIDPATTDLGIGEAYGYLSKQLNPTNFSVGSREEEQAQRCMAQLVPAYKSLIEPASREKWKQESLAERAKPFNPDEMKPFLGHICVAAGIITLDDLNEAISKQSDIDLPLGQILQEKALLSQTELDGLLMGQRLFGAPSRPLDPIVKRLLALNAVNKDMVKIVLIDQRTNFMSSITELLLKRGWLSPKILQILESQPANAQTASG